MVPERADAEPILPMGLLIEKLGCKIEWNSEGVCLRHPQRGILPIQVSGGCPQMARSTTLELIEELEQTATLGKVEERTFKEEVEWMKKLVETHPVLRRLPQDIKSRLADEPTSWSTLPVNRRTRKRMQERTLVLLLPVHGINKEVKHPLCWRLTSKEVHIMTFQLKLDPMQR